MIQGTRKQQYAWAFYDWANSAFAVVVLAGFYPIFFREFWAAGQDTHQITWYLGVANSVSSLVLVLLAPILGAIADQGGLKKRLLMLSSVTAMIMTAGLFWVGQGMWFAAALLFVLSTLGWMAANIFYDALLVDIAAPSEYDRVSALGYALGYLGGGILFSLCVWMTLQPEIFGLESASSAVSLSFILVGIWWAAFSLPLWLWVEEKPLTTRKTFWQASRQGLVQLLSTFHEVRRIKPIILFLLAYWLYIDGVDTVIRMAVDYGKSQGIGTNDLITALLLTQFVGFPAALLFGRFGQAIGAKKGILLGIAAYCAITIGATGMDTAVEFYTLAVCVGLVQGGIQSLSRSYYAAMIPVDMSAEYFGFYNMMGKFAAIIGPIMVGWIGLQTGSAEYGLLSLLLLFIAGAILLMFVHPEEKTP